MTFTVGQLVAPLRRVGLVVAMVALNAVVIPAAAWGIAKASPMSSTFVAGLVLATLAAQHAIDAARTRRQQTGHGDVDGPWVPVGIGVNTGLAYVGSVGEGHDTELTAMGDAVNTTARLASEAAAGEILVTVSAAAAAHLAAGGLEHRSLQLKGKTDATDVVVLDSTRQATAGETAG